MDEMNRYRQVNGTLDSFFVYFADTDTVLTPNSKTAAPSYFSVAQVYRGMDYETIKAKMLTGYHNREFFPAQWVSNGSNTERRFIPLVQSLPLGETRNVKGSLVLLIGEKQFSNLLKPIETANDSIIHIVDKNNQLILSTNETDQASIEPILLRLSSGFTTITDEDDQDMLLNYTSSDENGWKFIAVTPKAKLMSKVNEMKTVAILLLFLCLAAGAGACYAMAKRYYRPLREVVNAIMQGKKETSDDINNEFDFIKNAISASLEDEKQLRSTLLLQAPVMKSNFLLRLIKGEVDQGEETIKYLETLGIRFSSDVFSIILIDIADNNGFIREGREQDWTLIRFIIANIGNELLRGEGYIVELGRDQLAVLVNTSEPADQKDSSVRAFLSELREIVEQRYKITVTTATSHAHSGIGKIGLCYREALMALDYKMLRGMGSDIMFEEIEELKQGH